MGTRSQFHYGMEINFMGVHLLVCWPDFEEDELTCLSTIILPTIILNDCLQPAGVLDF